MIRLVLACLGGRGGRAEYWAGVLVAVALITVSGWFESATPRLLIRLAAAILWFVLTLRRLRDIGWWTWLVLLPFVPLVVGVAVVIVANQQTIYLSFIGGLLMMSAGPVLIVLLVLVGAWNPKRRPDPSAQQQAEVFS